MSIYFPESIVFSPLRVGLGRKTRGPSLFPTKQPHIIRLWRPLLNVETIHDELKRSAVLLHTMTRRTVLPSSTVDSSDHTTLFQSSTDQYFRLLHHAKRKSRFFSLI